MTRTIEQMIKRIYIVGCDGCGTTLLKRLFYTFTNVHVIPKEISIESFIRYKTEQPVLIGKRTCKSVFSNELSQDAIDIQLNTIEKYGLLLVNSVRNRDAMAEDVKPSLRSYQAAVKQSKLYYRYLVYTVPFESLTNNPDLLQDMLKGALTLTPHRRFSDYPDFVPDIEFEYNDLQHLPRRIGEPWR